MSDDKKDEGQVDLSGLSFTGKLTVDCPPGGYGIHNTKLNVSLSDEIIQVLTKQADLEALTQMNILRNCVTIIHCNLTNMAMNIEGTLRTNFPAMFIPGFSLDQPYTIESPHTFLNGTDMGSILTRGKLLSAVVNVGGVNVDYEGSVDSMFKRHFVYTNYKDPRKEDLNNLFINYFEVTEEDNIVSLKKAEPFIEGSEECLWWDNAPVNINIQPSNKTACLSFVNGRKMEVRIDELKSAVEIDYNVNLMLARFIETNYKFYDLVDNPINSYDKVVYRSFLEDAKSIYEENKKELKETIFQLAKIYRKNKITNSEDGDVVINDDPTNRVILVDGNHFIFERYDLKIKVDFSENLYDSRYLRSVEQPQESEEEPIDFDKLLFNDWDYVKLTLVLDHRDSIFYGKDFLSYLFKDQKDTITDNINTNFFVSNYLVKTLLEEHKHKIALFAAEYLKP